MQLADIVGLRPVPAAGLLVTMTQRCPLLCAHCSTASTMDGAEPDAAALKRFVGSFQPDDRPDVLMMTGGEPLLRPDLVAELSGQARRTGVRTALLTGAFFARSGRVPAPILRALGAVDHVSVSIDEFHERQVPRQDAFRLLRVVLGLGIPASVHAAGSGPADPYLADLVADVRHQFGDRVPMLVNRVRPLGRAAGWAAARSASPASAPAPVSPCAMAAWPVVAHDGVIVACCNQTTVDRRPVPEHLWLGDIAVDTWPTVRARVLSSPVLRLIRAAGPRYPLARYGAPDQPAASDQGDCTLCRGLSTRPEVVAAIRDVASGVAGQLLDDHATQLQVRAGPVRLLRRHGCADHADLVTLPRPARPAGPNWVGA